MFNSETTDSIFSFSWFSTIKRLWRALSYIKAVTQFISFFIAIKNWLSPEFEPFPPNEVGQLMEKHLANMSWLDHVSSGWTNRSLFYKASLMVSVILVSGLIGLTISPIAPILFSITSALLTVFTHHLLISHEKNRRMSAKIFAEETIAIKTVLNEKIDFFMKETEALSEVNKELKEKVDSIAKAASKKIDVEVQKSQAQHEVLAQSTQTVNEAADQLKAKTETVVTILSELEQHKKDCVQVILKTTESVSALGDAASVFSEATAQTKESSDQFTHAVNRFCIFGTEPSNPKTGKPVSTILERLKLANTEDDMLIQNMGFKLN